MIESVVFDVHCKAVLFLRFLRSWRLLSPFLLFNLLGLVHGNFYAQYFWNSINNLVLLNFLNTFKLFNAELNVEYFYT